MVTPQELMDKNFGSNWHVIAGEGFAFDITHETKNLMWVNTALYNIIIYNNVFVISPYNF